jgi:hypothetical protein
MEVRMGRTSWWRDLARRIFLFPFLLPFYGAHRLVTGRKIFLRRAGARPSWHRRRRSAPGAWDRLVCSRAGQRLAARGEEARARVDQSESSGCQIGSRVPSTRALQLRGGSNPSPMPSRAPGRSVEPFRGLRVPHPLPDQKLLVGLLGAAEGVYSRTDHGPSRSAPWSSRTRACGAWT